MLFTFYYMLLQRLLLSYGTACTYKLYLHSCIRQLLLHMLLAESPIDFTDLVQCNYIKKYFVLM